VEIGGAGLGEVELPCELNSYTGATILSQELALMLRKSLPVRLHLKATSQLVIITIYGHMCYK